MATKFAYKGKSMEEVSNLSLEDFSKLTTARARRVLKRGLTKPQKKLLEDIREDPTKFHRTHAKEMVILPEMVGVKIGIYNGKEYVSLEVKDFMIGHRLGEFALTRRTVKHSAPGFGATKSSKFIPLK